MADDEIQRLDSATQQQWRQHSENRTGFLTLFKTGLLSISNYYAVTDDSLSMSNGGVANAATIQSTLERKWSLLGHRTFKSVYPFLVGKWLGEEGKTNARKIWAYILNVGRAALYTTNCAQSFFFFTLGDLADFIKCTKNTYENFLFDRSTGYRLTGTRKSYIKYHGEIGSSSMILTAALLHTCTQYSLYAHLSAHLHTHPQLDRRTHTRAKAAEGGDEYPTYFWDMLTDVETSHEADVIMAGCSSLRSRDYRLIDFNAGPAALVRVVGTFTNTILMRARLRRLNV